MGSEDVSCAVCGKEMAYDDAYGFVESGDEMLPVCCRKCMDGYASRQRDAERK